MNARQPPDCYFVPDGNAPHSNNLNARAAEAAAAGLAVGRAIVVDFGLQSEDAAALDAACCAVVRVNQPPVPACIPHVSG